MMGDGLAPVLMLAAFVASIWLHVKVLRRAGRSGWWMLLAVAFPPFYLVGVWLFAFTRWPGAASAGGNDPASSPSGPPSGEDAAWPYHSDDRPR